MASYPPLTESNAITEPNSGVKYWVRFPDMYSEQFTKNSGGVINVNMLVAWDDAADWKAGMLGYTEGSVGGSSFQRRTPHLCPYTSKLYCQSVQFVNQFASQDQLTGTTVDTLPWGRDAGRDNWPYGGYIEYMVTYTAYPYAIQIDADIDNGATIPEFTRYIRKTTRSIPKERSLPALGFETCESPPQYIREVGFVPFIETEIVYTWFEIPIALVPIAAIDACSGRTNSATFDGYAAETVLFRGLAAPIEPYAGPSGELYTNLMYTMSYLSNGWNKLPMGVTSGGGDIIWTRVRERGSASGTDPGKPLYPKVAFAQLFKPSA